jgi:hypothetical protein
VYDLIDPESFLRGLVYQRPMPGCRRVQVESRTLAAVINRASLTAPMATWLRQQASRSDLDHATRLRAVQTLGYLRMESSGIPLSRTGPDWAARDFGTE